jgi:REP element-mobilizing transposase RayT
MRLEAYDYRSNGAYFITVVTDMRALLFGSVADGEMRVSHFGQIVVEEWARSSTLRPEVELDYFVVMPNHVHGIVLLDAGERRADAVATLPSQSLGAFVAGFKSTT